MEFSDLIPGGEDKAMSRLEEVDAEYRSLATKVTYAGFEGEVDPGDRRRLEELTEELMDLTDPDFLTKGSLAGSKELN